MKKYFSILLILSAAVMVMQLPAAKHELYGYSDFQFSYSKMLGDENKSFSQNRTNILLSSEIVNKWDFFLNIEFNGSFRMQKDFNPETREEGIRVDGSIELEEAWTGYTFSDKLKLKAGIFHAPFGSFNVIQDSSPTFISVRPPLIYDDDVRGQNPISIIPDKANLEICGRFRKKKLAFEYHLYTGNGLGSSTGHIGGGSDLSFGARFNINYDENLKIGVSTYYDNAHIENQFHKQSYSEERTLLSVDLDYSFWKLNVNAEYILNKNNNEKLGKFDRTFFYVNLNLEVLKKVRIYAEIDKYKDHIPDSVAQQHLGNGINKAIAGINFKPNWVTAIKAEIQHVYFTQGMQPDNTRFVTSLSVIF